MHNSNNRTDLRPMNLLPDLVEYDETEGYRLELDPTGLLNEGFRYRDPATGTFLTRDPLGFKAGLNNYTYVHQNPWTHFDPEGLWSWSQVGTFVGHAAASAAGAAVGVVAVTALVTVAAVASPVVATAAAAVAIGAVAYGGFKTGQAIYGAATGHDAASGAPLNGNQRAALAGDVLGGLAGGGVAGKSLGGAGRALGDAVTSKFGLGAIAGTKAAPVAPVATQRGVATGDTITVQHGTTSTFVPSLIKNGPDASFVPPESKTPVGGFSVATPHGPAVAGVKGTAQDYARDAASTFGGDPVVLTLNMPRSLYNKVEGDMTEKRFLPGSGLGN